MTYGLTFHLVPFVIQVVGIDTNTERLEVAREKYSARNIEYLEGSAEDIPKLADIDSYDFIFSNFVLHWCTNKERVFQEAYRVLKKGGKFGFVAGTDVELAEVQFTPEIVSSEYLAAAKERVLLVTMDEYMHHASDFEIEHAEESIYEWRFPDVHKYIDMLYMHAHGDFDMSHFNVEAARDHFGRGEITFGLPFGTFIASKQ